MIRTRVSVALLLLLLPGLCLAQKTYQDTKYGYSIKTIAKWKSVPIPSTEDYLITKWSSPRDIRDCPAQVLIYRFDRKSKKWKAPEGMPEAIAAKLEAEHAASPWGPKRSYAAWAKSDYERSAMSLGKGRKVKIKGPPGLTVSAKLYETVRDTGYTRGEEKLGNYFVVVLVVTTDRYEFAIEAFVHEREKRKYQTKFKKIARSFRITEMPEAPPEEIVASAGKKDDGYERTGQTPREEARKKAREDAERADGWWYHETANYLILTNLDKRQKAYILEIARRLEAIRALYEEDFPPKSPITAVSIVRVCANEKSYFDYGGMSGTAGYWYAPAKELVLYSSSRGKADTFGTLMHEAFHQYIYYACGRLSPHSWYNEGYGDYYAGAVVKGRGVARIDPFRWRQDLIKTHIRDKTHVPVKKIVRFTQAQYYAQSDLCYAQGWSLVYFLNKGLPANHPWTRILPTYFDVLQKTKDKKKAVDVAFKGVDFDALEQAWADFITRGKLAPPR